MTEMLTDSIPNESDRALTYILRFVILGFEIATWQCSHLAAELDKKQMSSAQVVIMISMVVVVLMTFGCCVGRASHARHHVRQVYRDRDSHGR